MRVTGTEPGAAALLRPEPCDELRLSSPLPLAGEGQGGGKSTAQTRRELPLPNPPPQAGEGAEGALMHLAVSNLCEPRRGVCLSAPRVHKLEPVSDSEAALGFRVIALNWGNPLKTQTPYATRRSNAVYRGRGRFLPPTGWARSSLTHGLRFLALAVAYVVASPHPVLAAADWVLVCPEGGPGEPHFRDQRGRALPILIPGERAIAEKLCNLSLPVSAVNVNVSVTNSGANTIYLAFTDYSTQLPGPITWTTCTVVNNQVVIPGASATPNNTCSALVPATAGKTRFCAFTSQVPVGQTPNCNLAQTYNQTMIETNFGTGSNGAPV
jgi:hypothetical protein